MADENDKNDAPEGSDSGIPPKFVTKINEMEKPKPKSGDVVIPERKETEQPPPKPDNKDD